MDQNIAPMLLLGLEIYELNGTLPREIEHCEKNGPFVKCDTRGILKREQKNKQSTIEVKNNHYLLQRTVHGVIVILFDAKLLMFSLNYTQYQIVPAGITFLAEKLMILLLRNLPPRVFF